MENKGVLVGGIVFVFGAFILMISLLVYESYKAKQMKALAACRSRPRLALRRPAHPRWIIPCIKRR